MDSGTDFDILVHSDFRIRLNDIEFWQANLMVVQMLWKNMVPDTVAMRIQKFVDS